MNSRCKTPFRVLAISPNHGGFGFAVLEGVQQVVDWGVRTTQRDLPSPSLTKVEALLRLYSPDTIVAGGHDGNRARRSKRVVQFITALRSLAKRRGMRFRFFSREKIRRVFASFQAVTRHQIAHAIARQLPEIAQHLPRYRKPWMNEDYRMIIFDAISLALTLFYTRALTDR